jgi:hypothetical protein
MDTGKKVYIVYFVVAFLILLIVYIQVNNFISRENVVTYHVPAKSGALDLADWSYEEFPLYSLDGEWQFYPGELVSPVIGEVIDNKYITVPGVWNSFETGGKPFGAYGYATYRLQVTLPENLRTNLALKIPDMSSSYRLYINGEELCSNGVVGSSPTEEKPYWKPLVRTIGMKTGEIDIVVHISNFHHMKGGMWEPIVLGTEEAIYNSRESNLMASYLMIGILIISAMYYLVIFSAMQRNRASIYLALFCLAAALREFLIREVVAAVIFPEIPFFLVSKLEYLTVPSGPILLALSIYGLYPSVFPKKALKIVVTPFLVYMAVIILTPLHFYGHFMNLCLAFFIIAFGYVFIVIVKAARKKEPGAGLLLFGAIVMLLSSGVDMSYYIGLHGNYSMAYTFSIGFIIFIICQMHSLSLIIADVFERSQRLSEAEMAFLQAQIVPHFLYNTLNTVIYLTRESPEKARSLLLQFSSYLRGKFDFNMYNQNLLVTLEHELEIVKSYLSIELVRFDNRLNVFYNIEERTLGCNIMPFVLQPLVENSVRHGLKSKAQDLKVVISAVYQQKYILITIEDNGIGMPKEKILSIANREPAGKGTGLYNVNRRLEEAYGEGLNISSVMNEGTTISFKIPVKETDND